VGYCDLEGCRLLPTTPLAYSNGIIKGKDGLIYVANSVTGEVFVNELEPGNSALKLLEKIKIPYPIDNLAVDSNGDIFVASFPQLYKFLKSTDNPFGVSPPTTAWRIRKNEDGTYQVKKILEDDGSVLPSATTALHDAQTGRMFLGGEFMSGVTLSRCSYYLGAFAPFISICEPL
jgi:arylesterase/paraoxonase